MATNMNPHKLHTHPSNELFDPLSTDVYQALKDDIAQHGMINPILATTDFTIIAGHHRVKAALELGLPTVPVEIQDVDATEAERLLIADNVLRRQLNPMEQARLIQRLKKEYGIRQGTRSTSAKMAEVAQMVGVPKRTAERLDRLNDLVPALHDLVITGKLGTTHGAALAVLEAPQQQALFDAIGESITTLKVADIQQAKRPVDTSVLEDRLAAMEEERDDLQAQLHTVETAMAESPDPSLLEALKLQLAESEATRQQYTDEMARLKSQTPVERIVEKVVPDPAQAAQIEDLERQLAMLEGLGSRLGQEAQILDEVKRLERKKASLSAEVESWRRAYLKALEDKTDPAEAYLVAIAQFVEKTNKRMRPSELTWRQLAGMKPVPVNAQLHSDIQVLAVALDAISAGLRTIPLDHTPSRRGKRDRGGLHIAGSEESSEEDPTD